MANNPASVPSRLQVMASPSASVALKAAPMLAPLIVFSSTVRVRGSSPSMTGGLLAAVVTVAQEPLPTAFFARTRTS